MTDIPNFTAKAACATADSPDDWHPDGGWMGNQQAIRAKAICQSCPALEECRAYAIPRPELYGLWGGLTALERQALRRDNPTGRRPRTHCRNGHAFSIENTQFTVVGRRCRTCHNVRNSRAKEQAS